MFSLPTVIVPELELLDPQPASSAAAPRAAAASAARERRVEKWAFDLVTVGAAYRNRARAGGLRGVRYHRRWTVLGGEVAVP